jgi:hypothetical protein
MVTTTQWPSFAGGMYIKDLAVLETEKMDFIACMRLLQKSGFPYITRPLLFYSQQRGEVYLFVQSYK